VIGFLDHFHRHRGYARLSKLQLYHQLMLDELATLKQDIDKGLADVAAGRVHEFNVQRIAERGRKLLAARSS